MKNKVLALVTGLSSLVLLAACSNQQNGMISTTSSSDDFIFISRAVTIK